MTSLLDLTNLLSGDLEDSDNLWNIAHQVKLVTNNDTAYKRKLVALENLITKLESEILNTPTGLGADEGAITASDRQHEVRQKYNAFQIVKEVYNEWETKLKRACAIYKRHSHPDGTPITEPQEAAGVHEDHDDDRYPGFEPRRGRSRDRKPGNDAKGLKPMTLSIDLPALQVHEWFKSFENYRAASGWSQDDHHIQMAYMRPCLSEDIRTAIEFDELNSVNQAITRIQEYLATSVRPITLQQLNVLRLTSSGGETQSQVTHKTIEMFRQANMFDITGNDLLKVVLLHTIQEKAVMLKVLEGLEPRDR